MKISHAFKSNKKQFGAGFPHFIHIEPSGGHKIAPYIHTYTHTHSIFLFLSPLSTLSLTR